MKRESNRSKLLSRRAMLLAGGKIGLLAALAGRLYYLQVVRGGRFAMLADENRINIRLLAPRAALSCRRPAAWRDGSAACCGWIHASSAQPPGFGTARCASASR